MVQQGDLILVWPAREHLGGYADALRRDWSPRTGSVDFAQEQLERITKDPDAFLASRIDREAKAGPVKLPDGSEIPRLPSFMRWLWDGEFCGTIGVRWQPGTEALPPTCLGHVGYSVVPWKRRRGYATRALSLFLPDVRTLGLRYVELTTDVDNGPSKRVIEANGGVLVEQFTKPVQHGGGLGLRYRIGL